MKKHVVTAIVFIAATSSWLIWVCAAPPSQDNSFRAIGNRFGIFILVSVMAFFGTVLAAVSILAWRRQWMLACAGLLLNITSVAGCWMYIRKPNATTLIQAVADRDVRRVGAILDRGVDVNAFGRWSWHDLPGGTALLTAIERHDAAMVELLLNRGADPNRGHSPDPYSGTTPLCAFGGDHGFEIARLLLDAGADPNRGYQEPPLFWALQRDDLESAQLLVERGARIHAKIYERLLTHRGDRGAQTLQAVEFLLAHGLDVDESWKEDAFNRGASLLLWAIECGHEDIAELLLSRGANPNFRPPGGDEPDYDGTLFPLSAAAKRGHVKLIENLIEAGADVNADYANPVSSIAPLHQALDAGQYAAADSLVAHGARPTVQIYRYLIFFRHGKSLDEITAAIDFLIANGLDTTAKNAMGKNELRAIAETWRMDDVLKFLAERGIE